MDSFVSLHFMRLVEVKSLQGGEFPPPDRHVVLQSLPLFPPLHALLAQDAPDHQRNQHSDPEHHQKGFVLH